jgi:hypothetical protein
MLASTAFVLGLAFNLIVFVVLVLAVISVFDISKRTKIIERRLIDLQEDFSQVKQSMLLSSRSGNRGAQASNPTNSGDA